MLAAAILSAGESRRMGTPKALLPYHGTTFVEHLMNATRHPRVGIVRVVLGAGAGADAIRAHLLLDSASVVLNKDWANGQLSSIQAAVRSLAGCETEGLLLCPVDHPLISGALVGRLIEQFDAGKHAIVVPTFRGRRGHPVIFRANVYSELLAASSDIGARQVVWAHKEDTAEVPTEEEGVVLNLNDPDTLKKALGAGPSLGPR
jgi:molybdenum cofactor cytidylyltransferase